MSLSRAWVVLAALVAAALGAGCTVQPLHGNASNSFAAASPAQQRLATVGVEPAETRVSQQVRNQLLFLLYGGAAEPLAPRYSVKLDIVERRSPATTISISRDQDEPTSVVIALDGAYSIVDTTTGVSVAAGRKTVSAAYDVPRQQFAALRAERDAQDRAARELAELIRLGIAQDLPRVAASF